MKGGRKGEGESEVCASTTGVSPGGDSTSGLLGLWGE